MDDPYFKLRPPSPTPPDELCDCETISEIYLAHKLGSNPVHCLRCNGEVPPERLGFDEKLAEAIAFWNFLYGSLNYLWLDSGEYEQWALDRLLDPKGQVNLRGMELSRQLGSLVRTYYLWFQDSDEAPPETCPVCGAAFLAKEGSLFIVCEPCLLIAYGTATRE